MAKKRIIFTLHYNSGIFCLSRNFKLQKVGNLEWLNKNYNFPKIAHSIDELIVLDVSRENRNVEQFCSILKELAGEIFVPISAGGGVRSLEHAKLLFESGADKIVLNSILYENQNVVQEIAKIYGTQSIVASIDYWINEQGNSEVFTQNGTNKIDILLENYLSYINSLPVGEIFLNSMRQDGTGQGYDLDGLMKCSELIKKSLIISGGAGNRFHFEEALNSEIVDAVATANLFNFIGNGLPLAREYLHEKKINIPKFENVMDFKS